MNTDPEKRKFHKTRRGLMPCLHCQEYTPHSRRVVGRKEIYKCSKCRREQVYDLPEAVLS